MSEFSNDDFGNQMNQKNFQVNISSIKVISYPSYFLIEGNSNFLPKKKALCIQKNKKKIQEIDIANYPKHETQIQTLYKSAFLGIINILEHKFLLFVEDIQKQILIETHSLYEINTISLIPIMDSQETSQVDSQIQTNIQNLKKLFQFGFYFSFSYDLSISKQDQNIMSHQSENKFQWNQHLIKDFQLHQINEQWIVSLISGFVGTFRCPLKGSSLDFYLISRRSFKRAGTRFNARGLDDDGNAANFVESEQIIYYKNSCQSHVLIRGSAPVFWQQRGLTAVAKVNRQEEFTSHSFRKHFQQIFENYQMCYCVNLMAQGKSQEHSITQAFEKQIQIHQKIFKKLKYLYFDFHNQCKNNNYASFNKLIKDFEKIYHKFSFFQYDLNSNSIISKQIGCFRINCLDSLDRTNVFMTKIAIKVFELQIKSLGVNLDDIFKQDILLLMDQTNKKQCQHPFIQFFKEIWADNGDVISKHYAGTCSTISNLTRNGKQTFLGMIDHKLKSIERIYVGNFEDKNKQESIELLTGMHLQTTNIYEQYLKKELKDKEQEFTKFQDLSIFICTWNVGNFNIKNQDLTHLFQFEQNTPDIIAIGLQEICDLNAKNIMINNQDEAIQNWISIIDFHIQSLDSYVLIQCKNLIGMMQAIFAKKKIKEKIVKVESDTIKCGVMNRLGNKGATIIRFEIADTSFCFINAHLEAGSSKNQARIQNIQNIHEDAFQKQAAGKLKLEKVWEHDYKFFFGDLNFRLNLQSNVVKDLLENYRDLQDKNQEQQARRILD